ncbi:DUF58 domain-containing protein [Schlesneria paludicola]|uniref:DUF58 domain-containing protein n=1 Tax=Schlesneria paludicola TaxID=360056 RepID=UPI00029AE153|nr:DUF58 domain-containing protein [Schlesneria paludicola]
MAKSPKYSDPKVLAAISGLMFRARHVVEGTISGLHKSPFHGHNVEFAQYREYSPGDDLRRLDWRVVGRTDRFYIKQYEEESNLQATIVMDASASMKYGSGPLTKFEYAATLAASLASLLIEQGDPVGLALFDNQQRRVLPPAATQSQLALIIGHLEEAQPDRETDLGTVLQTLGDQLKRRGLVVVISDLLTELPSLFDGLDRLRHRGNEVLMIHVLDSDELELPFNDYVLFRDIEGTEEFMAEPWAFRKAYCAAMQDFIAEIKEGCGRRGIDNLLLRTDQELAEGLSHYLHARERLQHIHRKGRR